ncbi:phosphonate metabolism transcriptional regulator PhnF [Minwuia sp.]|uniref:phosphonate metabolism transcriptional regulator PhnF n=1 Tax=Minwuia sp. TaxID=2493630 RepID=UPI003A933A63
MNEVTDSAHGDGKRHGIALWRQIADSIRDDLDLWQRERNGRIPSEADLAERFGVNRHTVRAALAALAREGRVRSERGRGTFVVKVPRISYPIRTRTRFSTALEAQNASGRITPLRHATVEADATIAEQLGLPVGTPVLKLDTLATADDVPISFTTHWFDAGRFGVLPGHLADSGSITAALKACGVSDYTRQSTRLQARRVSDEEARVLDLGSDAILMIAHGVNADLNGVRIQYSETRFSADRVEIRIDGPETPGNTAA